MKEQQSFWSTWVDQSRGWEGNSSNGRRAVQVLDAVDAVVRPTDEILDVGCGSGWLSREVARRSRARVTAIDLAAPVMEDLARRYPHVRWIGADFMATDLPPLHYDIVTCMETISHVPDQSAFVARIASLLKPGGTVVLTTQNPYVWKRTSWLEPPKQGQLRNWPSRELLLSLFGPFFHVLRITTAAPQGDRGLPAIANNPISRRVGDRLLGPERWARVREELGLGCSIVLVARKSLRSDVEASAGSAAGRP